MYTTLIILIVIISILLMLIVLVQNPKGGGLSSQFGGSGSTQLLGVKKTGDFLEKSTWTLAIALMVISLAASKMTPEESSERIFSPNLEKATETPNLEETILQPDNLDLILPSEDSLNTDDLNALGTDSVDNP